MEDSDRPPVQDRLIDHLESGDREAAIPCLDRVASAPPEERKSALGALRDLADERPDALDGVVPSLVSLLEDDERAVSLSTAKLLVTLADSTPGAVVPVVDALAERLADDEEFYYVRARCAEALGYVALEHPEEVTSPEVLADLRIGLDFEEPEVTEKLAKALEYVAIGDPGRLRHQVSSLAEHLDEERDLVRYHLCTALVAVGSEHPERLADAEDALRERLADDDPYVRGRAAEALGLLARSGDTASPIPELDGIDAEDGETPAFLTERVRFARGLQESGEQSGAGQDGPGTLDAIREGTEEAVEAITSPADGECSHCGLGLPEDGPPMCPRCGAPR